MVPDQIVLLISYDHTMIHLEETMNPLNCKQIYTELD